MSAKKRQIFLSSAVIVLLMLSCGGVESGTSRNSPTTVDTQESVSESAKDATEETVDTVTLVCNEEKTVDAVVLSVQCAPDADRDGAPDSDAALIEFRNRTNSPLYINFPKRLIRDPMAELRGVEPENILPHHIYLRVSSTVGGISTVALPAQGVLPLSRSIQSSDDLFVFDFEQSEEPIDLSANESTTFSFTCGDQSGNTAEEIWGVQVSMVCTHSKLIVSNTLKSDSEKRLAVVRPNYPDLDITHIVPMLYLSGKEHIRLFENAGKDYEVDVQILE